MLHLTSAELQIFEGLSEGLREGWKTKEETLTYEDSDHTRAIRMELMRLHDPLLLAIAGKMKSAKNQEELVQIAQTMDISKIADAELAEIFFGLGPVVLSQVVELLLKEVQSDDDLKIVEALTAIRHPLLESLQPLS